MEARSTAFSELPIPLRCLTRIAADFLLIGLPLWTYLSIQHFFPLLYRETEWGLLLLGSILFLYSVGYHIYYRNREEDGRGLDFFTYLFYSLSKRPISTQPPSTQMQSLFLFTLMQWLFIPLMLQFTLLVARQFLYELELVVQTAPELSLLHWFNHVLFPLSLYLILLLDFAWLGINYLGLGSRFRLRSVNTRWTHWLLVLGTLLPIYYFISEISPIRESELARFPAHTGATSLLRLGIWLFLILYLWSMLSLGSRRIHMAHKGIVFQGAYRWVRHPGYTAILGIWWLSSLPLIWANPLWAAGLTLWTGLVGLRALQEERHLRRDPVYRGYCRKVRYRFLPLIF